jgi:hypothetical protein
MNMTFNLCNIYHHLEMHFHLIMYAFYVPFYMCRSLHIRTYVLFSPNPRLRIFEETHDYVVFAGNYSRPLLLSLKTVRFYL